MLHARTRWQMQEIDPLVQQHLQDKLQIHPILARILIQRGWDHPDKVQQFLAPSLEQLHDPYELDDMQVAVERIRYALKQNEKIRIYGDYDADGVSSTSLMLRLFRSLGADVDYYIPHRFREGYGINKDALSLAKDQAIDLIISVDTGISAVSEAEHAKKIALDLIITDHHEPPVVLPDALAVINPKKPQCHYPFKQLAGVGVAFKLATAILGRIPEEWLDIVALGTIADLVPLVDENRAMVAWGLKNMNRRENVGLRALTEVSGIDGTIDSHHVGFFLGPRINASGRLESADQAVELLTTSDIGEATDIATSLHELNQTRQELVKDITDEAIAEVERNPELHQKVIVVAKTGWNVGVVGIVASRLVETYYRPTIVLGIDEEKGIVKGSARSIQGFDLYQALTAVNKHLDHYGGHTMAAGMTLQLDQLAAFHADLSTYATQTLNQEDYIPISEVDAELSLTEVDQALIEQLDTLAPFGMNNTTPRLLIEGASIKRAQVIGAYKNTLKLQLSHEQKSLDAVGFRLADVAEEITTNVPARILGELQINEWNGRKTPQMLIRDIHIPVMQVFDWRSNRLSSKQQEHLQNLSCLVIGSQQSARWRNWIQEKISWEELSLSKISQFQHLVFLDPPDAVDPFEQVIKHSANVERMYFLFGDAHLDDLMMPAPTREQFRMLYQTIMSKDSFPLQPRIFQSLERRTGLSKRMIRFIFYVFEDLGFVRKSANDLHVLPNPPKRQLTDSAVYLKQVEREQVWQKLLYSSLRQLRAYVSEIQSFAK